MMRIPSILILTVNVLVLAGCSGSASPEDRQLFQRAQEMSDRATQTSDHLRAAAVYQELIDRGFESGIVYFNQGNAYAHAKQPGRAVASYRRALRYRPRDAELQNNLKICLQDAAATLRPSLGDYLFFWQAWISYPSKFFYAGLMACGCFLSASLPLFVARLRWTTWHRVTLALLAGTVLLATSAAYDWYRVEAVTYGVVTAVETVARKGPGERFEPAFEHPLTEATECYVLGQRNHWFQIELPDNKRAWVPETSLFVY